MIFNIGSTFNTASLFQGNQQFATNSAVFSPFAFQTVSQGAYNGATIIQLG